MTCATMMIRKKRILVEVSIFIFWNGIGRILIASRKEREEQCQEPFCRTRDSNESKFRRIARQTCMSRLSMRQNDCVIRDAECRSQLCVLSYPLFVFDSIFTKSAVRCQQLDRSASD